ncbi:MAG: GGDEF domain-containing protein [Rhodospirillales bacterium]|nr:GGDEF domain-containing protein [Rhodospirillales bacterium]
MNKKPVKKPAKTSIIAKWKQYFIHPGKDPTKALRRAYVLALGLIALLTIIGHLVTAHITEQQKENAEIAYNIGRQRTLMQQVMLYTSNYYQSGNELDYDFLVRSLNEMESGHNFLLGIIDGGGSSHIMSPALYRIYHNPPFSLDENIVKFHGMVSAFTQMESEHNSKERKALVDKLSHLSEKILLPAMDMALESYQAETLEKLVRFYKMQLAVALFILIVLAAEAAFIFSPLIAQIKKYHDMLQKLALEDMLTGLNNRRAFINRSTMELKRSQRDQTDVTVALIDLDHFKNVNDTYGHEVGDLVLKHFSTILKHTLRAGDVTGRIGGEEFAIVLPKINAEGASSLLQRLCNNVASTPCPFIDSHGQQAGLSYTISVGFVGPCKIENETIDQLLAKADEALYQAKDRGRNQVVAGVCPTT